MSIILYFRPAVKRRIIAGDEPNWLKNRSRYRYVRRAILSCPYWLYAHLDELRELEKEKAWRSAVHEADYDIDHIIPLYHSRVCGLTVPWNLRIMPRAANRQKGHAWCQWHGELFDEPEQFKLEL